MAVRLYLDKHTLNRWPHPLGTRLKISATLSGLGSAAIVEDLDASPLGLSTSTMGMWANMDATSLISMGYLASLDLLDTSVENAVILTSHAPLTRGQGHADIALDTDIEVLVDGVPATIAGYDPVVGVLVLDQAVDPDSEVTVSYHYTPNPTLELTHLNSGSFLLNQWNDTSEMPFAYNTVLAPYLSAQPQVVDHRYLAFDYPYTSVLNDPTSMLLNEPRHSLTVGRFERPNSQLSVFFEGSSNPEDPWEWVGEAPAPTATIENGLFVVDDTSQGVPSVGSFPSFWRHVTDLTFNHAFILNFRVQLDTWNKIGDFTGVSAGWADDSHLYLIGFLEVGGFKTVGFLYGEGDETSITSYRGLEASSVDVGGSINTLVFAGQPPLSSGDLILVDGVQNTVVSVGFANNQWEVVLGTPLAQESSVNVHVEVDWTDIKTYRVAKGTTGRVSLFLGGSTLPTISIEEADAIAPEIFEVMENNSLFFGAVSRQGSSKSLWDFARYSILPTQDIEQDNEVFVESDFQVLPEDESDPWTLTDNQGYRKTVSSDFVLIQSAGQPFVGGGLTYTRIEPFLTSRATVDLTFRVRAHTYAFGMPAFLTVADEQKEVTIAFSDSGLSGMYSDLSSLSLLTKGFWGDAAGQLKTRGYITGFTPIPLDRFLAGFGGEQSFGDSGWTDTLDPSELGFIDHHMTVTHSGTPASATFNFDGLTPPNADTVSGIRLRIDSYTTGSDDTVSTWFGIESGAIQVFLKPFDDGSTRKMVFCTSSGALVLNAGNPIGFNFDFADGHFHHYKITRYGDNVTVFVDGTYQGLFDGTLLPISALPLDEVQVKFAVGTNPVNMAIDYAFGHSAVYEDRRIGVYQGGDLLDPSSYEWSNVEWLGTFAEVRVRRNSGGITEVLANDATIWTGVTADLPDRRNDRFNTNTELGYIQWGTIDPVAYAETLWDFVRYSIINNRERLLANNFSYINRHNVITSGEPIIDEGPEVVNIPVRDNFVYVSEAEMKADRVLAVTSLDGLTTYPFVYNSVTNVIALTGVGTTEDEVQVTFYHGKPFSQAYLENNWANTRLNEGTPAVPNKQKVNITVTEETVPDYFSPDDIRNDPADFIFVEGSQVIKFTRNEEAWYESLQMLTMPDGGMMGIIAPACDDMGLINITFEGPFHTDTYVLPPQGDEYVGHNYRIGYFNTPTFLFNDPESNMAGIQSPVSFLVEILEEDTYAGASDSALTNSPNAFMTDNYGVAFFNNPMYTLSESVPVSDPVYTDTHVVIANIPDGFAPVITDIDYT